MTFTSWQSDRAEQSISIPSIGLDLSVRLPPDASAGQLTIIETVNAPGFGPPRHRHTEVEVFRILEGRYLYEVDGHHFEVEAGDVISVPGGASHAFVNVTSRPARQLVIILPGLDAVAFFTGLEQLMRDGVPDRKALNHFGEQWKIEFLGPPLRSSGRTLL